MAGVACFIRFDSGVLPEEGAQIALPEDEAHHIARVLRLRTGDAMEVFDGEGHVWSSRLEEVGKRVVSVSLGPCTRYSRRGPLRVLAQAVPKGKAFEGLIRHVTEIGVDVIVPLITEHSEVRFDGARELKKRERWESIAVEACKQSKNPFLPKIHAPIAFKDGLAQLKDEKTLRLVGSLESGASWVDGVLDEQLNDQDSVCWLIGPEGDFSRGEYALAREQSFVPVKLAQHVLRVETAALYAWSVTDAAINRRF
ncbi:MAG TPA: 16S rRNA (uracil(1498)-N(3))-methyltransferase [Opitutae bacterium]|nr:16S rRNA (uracil(1498)-N(3))-methyltransferase [Opitutae bacterium]